MPIMRPQARRQSSRVHNPEVKAAVARIDETLGQRASGYAERAAKQSCAAATATVSDDNHRLLPADGGNCQARSQLRSGQLDEASYKKLMAGGNRPLRQGTGNPGPGRLRARRSGTQ